MQIAQNHVALGALGESALRGSLSGADVGRYSEVVGASWEAVFVQLEAGFLDAGIDFLIGDEFILYRETWARRLYTAGTVKAGMVAFGIPEGRSEAPRWWGSSIRDFQLPFMISGEELDLVTQAGETMTVLMFEESFFRTAYHRMTGRDPSWLDAPGHFLRIDPAARRRLLGFWKQVLSSTDRQARSPAGAAGLLASLMDSVELPVEMVDVSAPAAGVVDRVLHRAGKAGFRMAVPELSQGLGISRRTIEYAFRKHIGMSPHAYFTCRRLEACRKELEQSAPGKVEVRDVAIRHGFHELGRFAANYRRQFGELPSEALRRAVTERVVELRLAS